MFELAACAEGAREQITADTQQVNDTELDGCKFKAGSGGAEGLCLDRHGLANEEVVHGDSHADPEVPSLTWLLAKCKDDQLTSAFPTLLGVLSSDARAQCLTTVREALVKVAVEALAVDAAGTALWRRMLATPCSAASADRVKRPLHPMSMPFATVPAAKRLKVPAGDVREEPAAAPDIGGRTSEILSVYASNIPYEANEMRIRCFFEGKCTGAKLTDVRILRTPAGKSKGAAVLAFSAREDVERALALDGSVFDDRLLAVKENGGARPRSLATSTIKGNSEADTRAVIVKNLDFSASEANLGELFAGCGEIASVRIARDRRTGRAKGFAVVEFTHIGAVQQALRRSGRDVRGRVVHIEKLNEIEKAAPVANQDTEKQPTSESDKNVNETLSAGDKFAMAVDDLDAVNNEDIFHRIGRAQVGGELAGVLTTESAQNRVALHAHAKNLFAQAKAVTNSTLALEGKLCGEKPLTSPDLASLYPVGEEGLRSAAALAVEHDTPETLLAAVGAEALKGRLMSLGLKGGGSPLQRADRLLQLRGLVSLEQIPRELLAKKSAAPREPNLYPKPMNFVRARGGDA